MPIGEHDALASHAVDRVRMSGGPVRMTVNHSRDGMAAEELVSEGYNEYPR